MPITSPQINPSTDPSLSQVDRDVSVLSTGVSLAPTGETSAPSTRTFDTGDNVVVVTTDKEVYVTVNEDNYNQNLFNNVVNEINTPQGSNGTLQYNNAGNFAGIPTVTYSSITGVLNLGDVSNLSIAGGTSGQVLTTDGAGNLGWGAADPSNYGNANVANYLPTYTGVLAGGSANITGNLGAGNIAATGSLSAASANITGNASANNISIDTLATIENANISNGITFPSEMKIQDWAGGNAGVRTEIIANYPGNSEPNSLSIISAGILNLESPGGSTFIKTGVDPSPNIWRFTLDGTTILPTNSVIKTLESETVTSNLLIWANGSGDLTLLAGFADRPVEGGDLRISAGRGYDDDGTNAATSGGELLLNAGQGGTGNVTGGAAGGTILFIAGSGGSGNALNNAAAGPGGFMDIIGGSAGSSDGNLSLGNAGGYINIRAGNSTGDAFAGKVTLRGGNAVDAGVAGNLELYAGVSNGGTNANVLVQTSNNYTWTFDNTGNLTLPANAVAINFANGSSAFGNIVSVNLDSNSSNVLTGSGTFTALPVINANTVVWTTAPLANNSTGTAGQAAYDAGGNLYVCVATDTWAKFTGTTSW